MLFAGRVKELGQLRGVLDQGAPQVVRVTGLRGAGKTSLVRRTLIDYPGLLHRCAPLPAPAQFKLLKDRIDGARSERGMPPAILDSGVDSGADWAGLFLAARSLAEAGERPFVLAIDDAHRLSEARARHTDAMLTAQHAPSDDLGTLHLVLIGSESGVSAEAAFAPHTVRTVRVGPLPFRTAATYLPGTRPEDRVRAYALFGGIPRVLAALDPSASVETNVRRVLLDPHGTLADVSAAWLEQDIQSPARYVAIMSALALGEGDWATVHAGVPDLTKSGQVAPYLNRLMELGLISSRRPLDATPRSRTTRYAVSDPLLSFWFRFVLPYRYGHGRDTESEYYARVVRPGLDVHIEGVFPIICRQHMIHDSIETLGSVAREHGSLWGRGCDLPVAGILTSGAAYYGVCHWDGPNRTEEPLGRIERNMRETRYGFGRERRLRLIFTGTTAPRRLQREVARRHDAQVIDADALLGN
ncbi:MAG: ATP-binding protein [Gemmatimonadetes bacterium]|nr:ATP-binding protein [Gemmatimonadota bacterium]MDA1102670.1 ATP-binding protein [Gemmatimonadota bacterium]